MLIQNFLKTNIIVRPLYSHELLLECSLLAYINAIMTTIESLYEGDFPNLIPPNGVDNFYGMYCLGTYVPNASDYAIVGITVRFLQEKYESKRDEVRAVLIELAEQRLDFIPTR